MSAREPVSPSSARPRSVRVSMSPARKVGAGLAGAALGLVMERGFFRRLHGRPDDQILMSFGFIYVLTTLVQVVWGALPIVPFTVAPLTGSVRLGSISYPTSRVALTGFALVLA